MLLIINTCDSIIFGWETLIKGEILGDKDVDIKIMLTWIFEKRSVKVWTGVSWLKQYLNLSSCELYNRSCSILIVTIPYYGAD